LQRLVAQNVIFHVTPSIWQHHVIMINIMMSAG